MKGFLTVTAAISADSPINMSGGDIERTFYIARDDDRTVDEQCSDVFKAFGDALGRTCLVRITRDHCVTLDEALLKMQRARQQT